MSSKYAGLEMRPVVTQYTTFVTLATKHCYSSFTERNLVVR